MIEIKANPKLQKKIVKYTQTDVQTKAWTAENRIVKENHNKIIAIRIPVIKILLRKLEIFCDLRPAVYRLSLTDGNEPSLPPSRCITLSYWTLPVNEIVFPTSSNCPSSFSAVFVVKSTSIENNTLSFQKKIALIYDCSLHS